LPEKPPMNTDWNDFLKQHVDMATATAQADCALSDLSQFGWIRVEGDDARTLLQGQLTNDINLVTPQQAQLSAMCNPKGRIFSTFLAFERDDAIYLQLQREVMEPLLKRLSMFVLMAKATITDASDDLVSIGLTGNCANQLIDNLPSDSLATITEDQLTIIRHPGESPRLQLIGPADVIRQQWEKFSAQATVVNGDFWPLADIHTGTPSIFPQTMESFIPQMINLQLIEGVSFTKGCFTGQEVVARMHYLGKVKRRMYHATIDTDDVPKPGDEIFSPSNKSGQGAGNIVDARPSPAGGYEALVVTTTAIEANDDLRLNNNEGGEIQLQHPAYGFGQEED